MHKKSHICDYAIPISQLSTFGEPLRNRLTKQSYKALVSNFKSITPRKWISNNKLVAGERDTTILSSHNPTMTKSSVLEPLQFPWKALPVKIQQNVNDLLQYLTKEQLRQVVPEIFGTPAACPSPRLKTSLSRVIHIIHQQKPKAKTTKSKTTSTNRHRFEYNPATPSEEKPAAKLRPNR